MNLRFHISLLLIGAGLMLFIPKSSTWAEPLARRWVLRDGRGFEAELVAADGLRAAFAIGGKAPVHVAISELAASDAEAVRAWRRDRRNPLVVPLQLAPWPAQAGAAATEVQARGDDGANFFYESSNFSIASDLKLPVSVVADLARVFEATRAALIAMPLGLHAGGESEKYPVWLCKDAASYGRSGGPSGSGGHFDGRSGRMLVLLPNLGIEEKSGSVRLNYGRNLFVLKHEVTHQLLAQWQRPMPMWLSEGLAEFVASLPYAAGRYTLQPPGAGLRDYLLKWRRSANDRSLRVTAPGRLMRLTPRDWEAAVGQQEAYDLYDSAALLTFYFVQKDGGSRLAGFLEALRHNESSDAAEKAELMRDLTPDALAGEVLALARRLGVEAKLQP